MIRQGWAKGVETKEEKICKFYPPFFWWQWIALSGARILVAAACLANAAEWSYRGNRAKIAKMDPIEKILLLGFSHFFAP